MEIWSEVTFDSDDADRTQLVCDSPSLVSLVMNRPRLIRGLRIAWSVWWGILCVLLIVLWMNSYRNIDLADSGGSG